MLVPSPRRGLAPQDYGGRSWPKPRLAGPLEQGKAPADGLGPDPEPGRRAETAGREREGQGQSEASLHVHRRPPPGPQKLPFPPSSATPPHPTPRRACLSLSSIKAPGSPRQEPRRGSPRNSQRERNPPPSRANFRLGRHRLRTPSGVQPRPHNALAMNGANCGGPAGRPNPSSKENKSEERSGETPTHITTGPRLVVERPSNSLRGVGCGGQGAGEVPRRDAPSRRGPQTGGKQSGCGLASWGAPPPRQSWPRTV